MKLSQSIIAGFNNILFWKEPDFSGHIVVFWNALKREIDLFFLNFLPDLVEIENERTARIFKYLRINKD